MKFEIVSPHDKGIDLKIVNCINAGSMAEKVITGMMIFTIDWILNA